MPKQKRASKTASLIYEHQFQQSGCHNIMGFDEAGRGTWAGPVAAGAVCLPLERKDLSKLLTGVRDSKQMTPRQRASLVGKIKETALAWGVGSASSIEIDDMGIVSATKLAMQRAFEAAKFEPDCLLLDSLAWPEMKIPQICLIKGDTLSLSIAAASVLAKVWRDEFMKTFDEQYPHYEFGVHKGYGTAKHQAALRTYGPSPIHRMSFAPLRNLGQATNGNES
ncbi:MAG: ribonuclease HII [Chloroflexota bacterium]